MTESTADSTLDIGTLANTALSLFNEGKHKQCLAVIEELQSRKVQGAGLGYISSVCCFHLGLYARGYKDLVSECEGENPSPEAQQLYTAIMTEASVNPTLRQEIQPGRYVIAGIPPGDSGTGKFLAALEPHAKAAGFRSLYPQPKLPFSLVEKVRVCSVRDSEVLLLHPQTLGFDVFHHLVENNHTVKMYVLDSSFFCIRSYNNRPGRQGECLDCLGNLRNCHASCTPFPVDGDREVNLQFLDWLQKVAHRIHFFCQTDHQVKLLKAHFGGTIQARTIGMLTPEYAEASSMQRYDVVFHGEALAAKGINFFFEMARALPEHSFLVPTPIEEVQAVVGPEGIPSNVECRGMRWSTGLEGAIRDCRLVMCPSQWSAPVEGSLLKSLYYNGNVGVVETQFSFEREIPEGVVLRLRPNPHLAAEQVREFLRSGVCNREKARPWVEAYNRNVNLGNIFTAER